MTDPTSSTRPAATSRRASPGMKLLSTLAGARARRHEGRAVDLASQRRSNDRVTRLMRVPRGVAVSEEVLAGVPVLRLSSGGARRGTVLYLHGGAYALGSAREVLASAGLCADGGPDMVSVEYRLAPEHPFPAAVDDAIAVYRILLEQVGHDKLVVVGGSASGGLLLLLLQRATADGLPMPAATVPIFPWADLAMEGRSSTRNLGMDLLSRSELVQEAAWFAGQRDLKDAAVSPLYGSFRGFPRTYLPVGTHDLLLDDARRVAEAMRADGVDVVLEEWPGAIHGFSALPLRQGRQLRRQLRAFIDEVLPVGHSQARTG